MVDSGPMPPITPSVFMRCSSLDVLKTIYSRIGSRYRGSSLARRGILPRPSGSAVTPALLAGCRSMTSVSASKLRCLNPVDLLRIIQSAHESHPGKEPGGPEALELVEIPVPQPKANEAVVKIAAAGVNFIDVYHREGRYPVALPFVIGQEGAGMVSAVGAEVKSVKAGDRVAWTGIMGRMRNTSRSPPTAWSRFRRA